MAPRDEIRKWIVTAVQELLREVGYDGLTIAEVARRAGVGKGTVYLYFPSKNDLVLSHVDDIVERAVREMKEIAGERAPLSDRLERMLIARVLIRFDGVAEYGATLDELLRAIRPHLVQRRRAHFRKEMKLFASILAGARELRPSPRSAERTAELLVLATNSLLPFDLGPQELADRAALARKTRALAKLLVSGIAHQE